MTQTAVRMSNQGRVVIPAPYRHDLGITPETDLVAYIEDGRVIYEERSHLKHRLQREALGARTGTDSVVDELIAERRAEAQREETGR